MKHNYFNYPNEKLPPYGSVAYFSYRKLSDEKKEALYCLDQIKSQIISCTEIYSNIEVANEKMNWWIQQVNAVKNNQSISSPQIKTLLKYFDKELLYKNLIEDISHAIENSSNEDRVFLEHIEKSYLGIETLKASYLNDFKTFDISIVKQLNINNEIIRNIFQMPKHYYNQIIFDKKISPAMDSKAYKTITKEWLNKYSKISSNNLKPLITMNKIHHKMVKKSIKKVNNPFRDALIFSPLALLIYSI